MRRQALRFGGLVLSVVLMASGCSGSDREKGDVPDSAAKQKTEQLPVTVEKSRQKGRKKRVELERAAAKAQEARKQVSLSSCSSISGGWSAAGEVANSGSATRRFAITVYFTDEDGDTLNYATASVGVAAGKEVTWAAEKKFKAPKHTRCVLAGVTSS